LVWGERLTWEEVCIGGAGWIGCIEIICGRWSGK
jgi:hypothetical protein